MKVDVSHIAVRVGRWKRRLMQSHRIGEWASNEDRSVEQFNDPADG